MFDLFGPKVVVAPPGDDPFDYYKRWKAQHFWKRPGFKKGFKWGSVIVAFVAIVLKIIGVF